MNLKHAFHWTLALVAVTGIWARGQLAQELTDGVAVRVGEVKERGPHHQVQQLVREETVNGQKLFLTNEVTVLGTGINYWDEATGSLQPTKAEFVVAPGGEAVITSGPHKVILSPSLAHETVIDVLMPDNTRFRARPMFLSYRDRATGRGAVLAQVVDSVGQIVAPNVVVYQDCLDHVRATLRYEYLPGSISQFLLIESDLPPPEAFGLKADDTTLELWTGVLEAPQNPELTEKPLGPLLDTEISFGSMKLGDGKAFDTAEEDRGIAVAKAYGVTEGMVCLVELIDYHAALPRLKGLPPGDEAKQNAKLFGNSKEMMAAWQSPKQKNRAARVGRAEGLKHYASLTGSRQFVVDWTLSSGAGLNDGTLRSDQTYWVQADTTYTGTLTVEPACVVKYDLGKKIVINGNLKWLGTNYAPAIFTSKYDHSVGQQLTTTVNTTEKSALIALEINDTGSIQDLDVRHIRISRAQTGLAINTGTGHKIRHAQFVQTTKGIALNAGATLYLGNALFDNVTHAVTQTGATSILNGEHLTLRTGTNVRETTGVTVNLKNSLIVDVANTSGQYVDAGATVATTGATAIFTAKASGNNYLALGSPHRDQGTATIDSSLSAELQKMTTYPPIEINTTFAADTVLSPIVSRDLGVLDRGWHYPVLDYVWGSSYVSGATVLLTNGACLAGSGLMFYSGKFVSHGRPEAMNRITLASLVQEQPTQYGSPTASLFNDYLGSATVDCRFTFLTVPGGGPYVYPGAAYSSALVSFRDSHLIGGKLTLYSSASSSANTLRLTNNVLERCAIDSHDDYMATYNPVNFHCYNNLIINSTVALKRYLSQSISEVFYNCFDNASVSSSGYLNPSSSFNAYKATTVLPGATETVILTTTDYVGGPLGRFYYPITGGNLSSLIDRSTMTVTPASRGLYHYTVRADLQKEGAGAQQKLDIGFHYVATVGSSPIDTDSDSYSDVFEDRDGNGIADGSETSWQVYNSPNGLSSVVDFSVFTLLK